LEFGYRPKPHAAAKPSGLVVKETDSKPAVDHDLSATLLPVVEKTSHKATFGPTDSLQVPDDDSLSFAEEDAYLAETRKNRPDDRKALKPQDSSDDSAFEKSSSKKNLKRKPSRQRVSVGARRS
jgi:hypothetical protein